MKAPAWPGHVPDIRILSDAVVCMLSGGQQPHLIRVPRRLRELQSRIYDDAADLAQRHGRAARPSEIARHLGVDVEIVLDGLAAQTVGQLKVADIDWVLAWSAPDGRAASASSAFAWNDLHE